MNLDSHINLLLGLSSQLKIFHWQTKGYARHKAFEKTRDTMEELMDQFVEESMGQYGRFTLNDETKTISLVNLSEIRPADMIETICQVLVKMDNEVTDTNLLNIRDEMLGTLQKLKYLLTLE